MFSPNSGFRPTLSVTSSEQIKPIHQATLEVPDGLEHFKPLALSNDRFLIYDEIVLLVGQGNFVATLCRASRASWEGQLLAQVDIFRIENGLVVEHWDNSEPSHQRKSGSIAASFEMAANHYYLVLKQSEASKTGIGVKMDKESAS